MARNVALNSPRDLIVAPATAPGAAAIAIVRMTGPGARQAASRLFSRNILLASPGQLLLGRLLHPETCATIDHCLAASWVAPDSVTGEDIVEFHLHGSPAVVTQAMEAAIAAGARAAEPGEFTRRAFLNGKIDLAQAEAVCDLTRAQTTSASRAALAQLSGGLSHELDAIRELLISATAELEAAVDYPEEDIPLLDQDRILHSIDEGTRRIDSLLETWRRGRRLFGGARVVLAGPPNAGKSSLFNALLRRERAIVTPHAGTTRDVIEAVVDLAGIPLTLIDTAGLRPDPGEVEALGIQRSREEIHSADLVLFVVDGGESLDGARLEYQALGEAPHFVLVNKADRTSYAAEEFARGFDSPERRALLLVSVKARTGIAELEQALIRELGGGEAGPQDTLVTSQRHHDALAHAAEALRNAGSAMRAAQSPELVVLDLQTALSEIDSITGRHGLDEAILDQVFSRFCLGK